MLTGINHGSKRVAAFVVAVAASALLCALWAGVASAARGAAASGTLEICKSAANGAAGASFSFNVQKGTAAGTNLSVVGGTCSTAMTVDEGTWKISENNTANWVMVGDTVTPDAAFISDNLRTGLVKVTVTAGQETQVSFENAPSASTLKVCKWSASDALRGKQYSFTVGTQTVQATAGSSPETAGCSQPLTVQIGSKIKITEAVPANETVASITYSPSSIGTTSSGASTTVKTVAGPNVVTFENEPVGPPQNGFIEICKDAWDYYVNGTYHFEITNLAGTVNLDKHADGTTGEDVLVGQCTAPIQVPAGPLLVTEGSNKSTELVQVWTDPANALGVVNLANQTAVIVVPVAADSTGEVQVHFVNKTLTATLKICKFLPVGSEGLAGQEFDFAVSPPDVNGTEKQLPIELSIIAAAGPNGACKIVTDRWGHALQFPIGTKVKATEDLSYFPFVSGDGGAPGADDVQPGTIVGGINTISFHNVALGQLEICKRTTIPLGEQGGDNGLDQFFTFNYVNTADKTIKGTVKVARNACSLPQVVPAGNYTITEDLSKNQVNLGNGIKVNAFQFVASDARGPLGDNRCVPPQSTAPNFDNAPFGTQINTNCGNPLTVSVPYFNSTDPIKFGETQVTVWNKVVRGQLKICKKVTDDSTASLGNTTFHFTWAASTDGTNGKGTADLKPGTCTGNMGNFPIAKSDGNGGLIPNPVTVTETGPTGIAHVNAVSLTGGQALTGFGTGTGVNGLNGTIPYTVTFNPGPGVNVVTYTNQSEPARA